MHEALNDSAFRASQNNPGLLADFSTVLVAAEKEELQEILQEVNGVRRLRLAYTLLLKQLQMAAAQTKIRTQLDDKMQKSQKEYYLREQMKMIKKELGLEKDDKETLMKKFKAQLEDKRVPREIQDVLDTEFEKLSSLDKNMSEFNVTELPDWLTCLPFDKTSIENFNIRKAQDILNRDYYGLQDVKDRILEFIAVGKLKGSVRGRSSVSSGRRGQARRASESRCGVTVSRVLRFSVGGLHDVAEIKGHRRTYIGAMPGKLIQCLKQVKVNNPLVLIDEIDKLGKGHQGDPASALLEVLDLAELHVRRPLHGCSGGPEPRSVPVHGERAGDDPGAAARPHGGGAAVGLRPPGEGGDREQIPDPENHGEHGTQGRRRK